MAAPGGTVVPVLGATMAVAAAFFTAPEVDEARALVEASVAAEVLVPPAHKDPRTHVGYGAGVSAALRTDSRFMALVGLSAEHVVRAWLADPARAEPPTTGRFAGTVPQTFRGHLVRVMPNVRLGLVNDFAFGYFGLSPGYALRTAALTCVRAPCTRTRATDSGLNLGLSMGAMIYPLPDLGLVIGAEVGLDWAWFPRRHAPMPGWNQAMSARALVGWRI